MGSRTKALDEMSASELRDVIGQLTASHQRAVEELHVYETEFRTQQAQLIESHRLLESSLDRYANLYDFAPVACATIDRTGIIREINLTGAALLDLERQRIIGLPFLVFVAEASGRAFLDHLMRCRRVDPATDVVDEIELRTHRGRILSVELQTRSAAEADAPF